MFGAGRRVWPRVFERRRFALSPDDTLALDVLRVAAGRDEDRVGFLVEGGRLSFAVADGAGTSGRGAKAAERVVAYEHAGTPADRLHGLDRELARIGAEAAAVLGDVTLDAEARLVLDAAAVGDVRAWARVDGAWHELTRFVPRKPLLGSSAVPTELGVVGASDVIVATDGLAAIDEPPATSDAPLEAMLEMLRARRALWDDVAAIWLRRG